MPAVNLNSVASNPFQKPQRPHDSSDGWGERDQSRDRRNQNDDRRRNESRFDDGDSLVFEVESTHIGMVIGRGGSKIKEIQEKFNVHMNIGNAH